MCLSESSERCICGDYDSGILLFILGDYRIAWCPIGGRLAISAPVSSCQQREHGTKVAEDKRNMLSAVHEHGDALMFADEELRKDRDVHSHVYKRSVHGRVAGCVWNLANMYTEEGRYMYVAPVAVYIDVYIYIYIYICVYI